MDTVQKTFQKAEVNFVDDVAFKYMIIFDGEDIRLCIDLMDVGRELIQYKKQNKESENVQSKDN